MDPTGLWYYDLDEETGDWFAIAERGDTIWGLSEEAYGTSEYAGRLQKDNEIAKAESIQAGQRLQLGIYNDAAKKLHGQFLKHGYMFGEVSYDTIRDYGFAPWKLMDQDEEAFMKDYYIALELLYQSGIITKEQYEKESSRIESKDGRPDKGYWYESIHGNITPSYDEAYLAAGLAAIRTVQIFGPVVASRPFFQKLGSDIPDVKYSTTSKRYVMEVCNGVIRYRDTVTGRFVMDPFKHVHTSLSDPRLWNDMVSRMNEINKTLKSSREAQTLFEALEAYLKHKVIK